MRILTEIPFAHASQRLALSLPLWPRPRLSVRPKQPPKLYFSPATFDADNERRFFHERQPETLSSLKTALLLATACTVIFSTLGALHNGLSNNELIGCWLTILTIGMLWTALHCRPQAANHVNTVAKLSAILAVIGLIGFVFIEATPDGYTQIWIGLLPVYFFVYGQLFMSLAQTLRFGLLAMIALPLSGYLVGAETATLMSSILILLAVNAFGVSARRQLEIRMRKLFYERRKAECIAAAKTRFLLQLSHNLCQPIRALSCYATILDSAIANKPDDPLQPVVAKLGSAIDEFNASFNRILDIANLESGKQIPQLAPVDINILLAKLENQFAPQAAQRGLKLNVRLRCRPPYAVLSDASILGQIIGNLIDNAIKYTATGWVMISVVNIGDDRLKLHVCDSGVGIAAELHGEIFEEFFRCHRNQAHGLGVGLSYALKATQRLPKHSLHVYSRPHYGSDFQLCLPVSGSV